METKVRLLAFDARNLLSIFPKKYNKISSVNNIIDILRKNPGDPDKPVRLLEDENGTVLVVKFGLGEDILRQPCIEDELINLKRIQNSKIVSPHLPELKWSGTYQEVNKPLPSCVVCTKFIKPLLVEKKELHTLRSLAESGNDKLWRDALFQTIYTLICLQNEFPGFRHNDLKGDNVLITEGEDFTYAINAKNYLGLHPSLRLRRVWTTSGISAKIIDFELACTPEGKSLKSQAVLKNDEQLKLEYGLSTERCDVFDIHLLCFDTLSAAKHTPIYDPFKLFLIDFFTEKYLSSNTMTPKCRLNEKSQVELQQKLGPHILLQMLAHPYFYHSRKESGNEVMYELLMK